MAKKRSGWEMVVYYGVAGSTASTQIDDNVVDVDPGGSDPDFVDLPDRGDGSMEPQTDEYPVLRKSQPTFSMRYKDSDANMVALLAAADARPMVGKAFKFLRRSSGVTAFDGDCWIKYSSPGPLTDGQIVEFELHPTSAYGREWSHT